MVKIFHAPPEEILKLHGSNNFLIIALNFKICWRIVLQQSWILQVFIDFFSDCLMEKLGNIE